MNVYGENGAALLTDLYELTMMQGYFFYKRSLRAVFDLFFRRPPFQGGYAVFAGLEPFVRALLSMKFSAEDLAYLKTLGLFRPEFLKFLSEFRFRGDIYAVEEGTAVFPGEPLVRVHGGAMEAQFVESFLLNTINFQTLIATKAARMSQASGGRAVIEFGLRRAQGMDGALSACRAAFIGGAAATSNVLAAKVFGIPAKGTMAHSWVMAFGSEAEAFRKYAELYPGSAYLLVDTYDTLGTGLPAAVKVLKKLKLAGMRNFGVRLDSGDLDVLSRRARVILDKAGLKEAKIIVSNELNERIIEQLAAKKVPVDYFGVGTNLVTAQGDPALTGVYKLVATKPGNAYIPAIKVSDNPEKTSNPGVKNVMRFYGSGGKMAGDLIFLERERGRLEREPARGRIPGFYHPEYARAHARAGVLKTGRILLRETVKNGRLVRGFPNLAEVRKKAAAELASLPEETKRLLNPQTYMVGLSRELMRLKLRMVKKVEKRR